MATFEKNREWYISNGQKCRCREDVNSEKLRASFFKAEHTVDYLGDYRGEHLFKVTIPLIKIDGNKQFYIEKFELRSEDLDEFTFSKGIDDRKILIILPKEFASSKSGIRNYYQKRFSEVLLLKIKKLLKIAVN